MKISVYLVLLLSVLWVSACSGSVPQTPVKPTTALETLDVKIASLPFIFMVPWYIAQDEGYFDEVGLNVEFVAVEAGAQAVSLVMQGGIDVAPGALTAGLFNAVARGGGGRMVAGSTQWSTTGCTYSGILAAKDGITREQLDDPEVLRGIDMQVKPADMTGFYVDRLLEEVGLQITDINPVDLPPASLGEALQSGSLDLVQISEPWLTVIVQSGQGVLLIGAEEVIPNGQLSSIVFSQRIVKDYPEIGRRVLIAYLKGLNKYNEGKTDRNVTIVVKHTQLDVEIVKAMCWPTLSPGGRPDIPSVLAYQEWLMEQGLLDRILQADEFYIAEFVDYADQYLSVVHP